MNIEDMHIVELAKLLAEQQVESDTVHKAMKFIAECFELDGGFVYEIDQNNQFNRKESYTNSLAQAPDYIASEVIGDINLKYLNHHAVSYISSDSVTTDEEKSFLELFSAPSLAIASISNKTPYLFGFIVFYHHDASWQLPIKQEKNLNILLHMFCQYIDMRMYQNKLEFAQISLESVLDNTGIDIYVNDFHTHDILYVNKSMAAPYGGKSQFFGRKCWEVLFPGQGGPCEFCPQKNIIDETGNPSKVYTWDYQRAFDGSWFRVFSAAFRWVDGRLAHVVSSADITDNKRYEKLVQYMADYDSLTDLPNRRKLVNDCEKRLADEHNESWYLLFFDIDGFKRINDCYGHKSGDEFLIQLGVFFSKVPMLKDHIYRNGGDEFVAILDNVTTANIRNLASFIHSRFMKPWVLQNGSVYCNTSIGVSKYPEDGKTAEELLNRADNAMYEAKKNGGGQVCFYKKD